MANSGSNQDRYRERIRDVPEDKIRDEMLCCLRAAKPRHLKGMERRKKRTQIVPTGCCFFVFAKGNMVTVLKEMTPRKSRP